MRSLALKGRRFETWAEIAQAVERATAYWNEHKHPFIWGRRRRHRTPRRLGLAAVPTISGTYRMHHLAPERESLTEAAGRSGGAGVKIRQQMASVG